MKEGEPELGGLQVPHTDVSSSVPNPDSQPVASATPQITQSPQPIEPTKPITPQPQPQTQPSQSQDQLISQTFASNNTTAFNNPISQPPQSQFRRSPQLQPTPQPFPTQSITSNTGDVVLPTNASKSQKPKKGLIITIIIILLLATVGVGVYFLFQDSNQSNSETEFISFMQYMIDENKNEPNISNFDPEKLYSIDIFFDNENTENKITYFKQLFQYWNNYSSSIKESDKTEYFWIIDDGVRTLELFAEKPFLSDEEILKQYLYGGEDAVYDYTLDYYSSTNSLSSNGYLQYLAYQDDYINNMLKLIELYKKNGCIVNNEFDSACIDNNSLNSTDGFYEQAMFAKESSLDFMKQIKNNVKNASYELFKTQGIDYAM